MRLFIAVDLPEDVKQALLKAQAFLPEAKLKPVGKEQMHLTLKFLGEVSEQKANLVIDCLQKVSFKPFKTALDKVGIFPSESYIRVVWAGLSPEKEVNELQKRIDEALEEEFTKDKKFKAHLTLARVRFIEDKTRFASAVKNISLDKIGFKVDKFKLKKSTLTRAGAIYEDIASFKASTP